MNMFRIQEYTKGWVVEVQKQKWYGKKYWTHFVSVAGIESEPWYYTTLDFAMIGFQGELKNYIKIRRKPNLQNPFFGGFVGVRYPMTYDQPCQIDCRVTSCKYYKGAGVCSNISPEITLNENGKFVCWSSDPTDR